MQRNFPFSYFWDMPCLLLVSSKFKIIPTHMAILIECVCLHACVYILCIVYIRLYLMTFITNILHKKRNILQEIMTYFV
jgi:hypothetical protein